MLRSHAPGLAAWVVLGLAGSFLVSGCSASNKCLPEPMSARAEAAGAGSGVEISAPPAACDLGYGPGKTYELTLVSPDPATRTQAAVRVPVRDDGSFSTRVPIPRDFPEGPATVLVTGSPLDECGAGGSCAAYSVAFTLKR